MDVLHENTLNTVAAVDYYGREFIFSTDILVPYRGYYIEHLGKWIGIGVQVPKGSIKKLIGRCLTWEDEPVELKEY